MKAFRSLAIASLMGLSAVAMAALPANAATSAKSAQCRDAKGHFAKCDAKAKPAKTMQGATKAPAAKPAKPATTPAG